MSTQRYQINFDEPRTLYIPGLDFLVNLEFSGNSIYRDTVFYGHGSSSVRICRPLPKVSILINRQDLHNEEKARQLITEGLRAWPLIRVYRREIVELALHAASGSAARVPSSSCHNFVGIGFRANLFTHLVFRHGDGEIEEAEFDVGGGVAGMVPATEVSIENLEKKKARVAGSGCPVCLEEFPLECEVVRMPCSHDFHGDCIKEWLRASHYCPLCRFEMPTS